MEDVAEQSAGLKPASDARSLIAMPFAIALIAIVCTYWTVDIVSPALPVMKDDLELSAASAGLIYSILFLGRLLGNFPAAYLLDRIGTAATAGLGGIILVAGSSAAAIAPSGFWLSPARVLQGAGIAFLVNACLRAVLGAKPGRGAAMTYFSFAATIGGVFGLQSGGYLTDKVGWRSVFVLSAVIAAAIAVMVIAGHFTNASGRTFDAVPMRETSSAGGYAAVIPPLVLNLLLFFNYSPYVALPLYTEHHFGASGETNARLLMVITVTHMVAAFPAGRAIRQLGAQWCLAGGMLCSVVGLVLVRPMPGLVWIAIPLVIYGIGQVTATSAGGDIVLHLGGQSTRAIGLVRFSSDLGLVIGPYATGTITDHFGYGAPFIALPLVMGAASIYALAQSVRTRTHPV